MTRVVNIKNDYPAADVAVFNLSVALSDAKKMGEKALIVIHGYGSHGQGGEIKKRAIEYLNNAVKNKLISFFVCGENWGEYTENKIRACEICPDLILHPQLTGLNSGVTVVILWEKFLGCPQILLRHIVNRVPFSIQHRWRF